METPGMTAAATRRTTSAPGPRRRSSTTVTAISTNGRTPSAAASGRSSKTQTAQTRPRARGAFSFSEEVGDVEVDDLFRMIGELDRHHVEPPSLLARQRDGLLPEPPVVPV